MKIPVNILTYILAYTNKQSFFSMKILLLPLCFITTSVYSDVPFLLKNSSKIISDNKNNNKNNNNNDNNKYEATVKLINKAVVSELRKNKGIEVDVNNKFIIPSVKNVKKLGGWVSSRKIILININKSIFLRIGKGQYKINNKKWDDKKIKINNGDYFIVRHKSSLFNKGEVMTSIYLNNSLKFTFASRTK